VTIRRIDKLIRMMIIIDMLTDLIIGISTILVPRRPAIKAPQCGCMRHQDILKVICCQSAISRHLSVSGSFSFL
jgi:hypothetical protein